MRGGNFKFMLVFYAQADMLRNVNLKLRWACGLGCAVLVGLGAKLAKAEAAAEANPYSIISDRNVFHLNPPPPPPAPIEPKPVELPKVMLTGFVGKGKIEKVCLAIANKEHKEDTFMTLTLDEMQHDVKLVAIRPDKREVDIINAGTPQTLSVKSNGYVASAPAAQPGGRVPGMPGMPGVRPGGGPRPPQPAAPGPAASIGSSGGSIIMAGHGGGGGASSPFGGGGLGGLGASPNAPIVYGGNGFGTTSTAPGNNVGNQISAALINQATGHYQMPTPSAPAASPEVQAAGMIVQKQLMGGGGPPLPPSVQAAVEGLSAPEQGGGPPGPP
jgi:hypothetical protein